jgi:uncharacterized protein YjdB
LEHKYLGQDGLAKFLEKLHDVFSIVGHSHTKSQITDLPTIPTDVSQLNNDKGYLTSEDISNLEITVDSELSKDSENPVQNKVINKAITGILDKIDDDVDIFVLNKEPEDAEDGSLWIDTSENYVGELPSQGSGGNVDLTGYATEQWVQEQNYLTEVPEGYAKTEDIPTKPEDIGAQPKGEYALKSQIPTVPTKVSAFENDSGYLTKHQDISGKVDADKLPEEVNPLIDTKLHSVMTYGAKGDGVTNDTKAFRDALANNRIVTVPGGTYVLSDTLVIRENCCLELSQDTVLQFTQTEGNCVEMRGSAVLRGNQAVISAAFGLTDKVISMDTLQDGTNHASIPPYAKADPQWKRQRFVYDINIIKTNASGFNRPLADGVCRGTAIYMSATNVPTGTDNPDNADIPFMWGITMSGVRIAGGFSYGIHAVNYDTPAGSSGHYADDAWNHDMRIEAVIEACEIGVCLDNCNGAHLNVTVQPNVSNPGGTKYAKQGICLRDSRFVDMMRSRVWDWHVARTDSPEYQHIALYGNCRGLLLDDYLVHENPGIDIREQIYTDTPANFDTMTILQEPTNKYFKSVDGAPYFYNGTTDRKLMLATDKFSAEQAEFIKPADGYYTYEPNFKNLVDGYTDGTYLAGSSTSTIADTYTTTDFIPIDGASSHVYRIGGEGITWDDSYGYCRIAWYNADKSLKGSVMAWNKIGSSVYYPEWVEDETVAAAFATNANVAAPSGAAWFRITAKGKGVNLIVTVDEPQEYNAIWYGEPKRLDESIHAVTDWNAVEGEVGYIKNKPDSIGNVELDTTLTQSGKAADAKAVGDKIAEITGISLVEPAYDDIPKVFFGGPLQQTKDEKVVPFRYISKTDDFSGYAEIKAQGNSSMNYPKKNQTVKMFKDAECSEKMKVDFKGWGKQNKHVYKANWIDLTHARNVVSARLWADVVKSRANYQELPELFRTTPNQGAMDGFPVKVYADGVYQGRYTLNIPKDKWAFNMDDKLAEHCVLCGEGYESGCFRVVSTAQWTDEIHDSMPVVISNRWKEVITFVMNSTDDEFRANLSQYFYVDSLIDYYLFGLASCGLDAFGKNQIYATYDGQKWIASMYDMDSTWGLYWNGGSILATDYARTSYEDFVNTRQGNLLYIRLEQLFWSELQTRWAELKNGALSITNIINRFERFTDITPAELLKEDYASTTGGGKFTGIPSKDTNNIQQIRSFALARQAWTDAYVAALTGSGEIDPEEPDLPDVPDEPDEGANILDGVLWHYNTFNANTGGGIISNSEISTDAIDVSVYAGKAAAYKVNGIGGCKVGFWDESGKWISGIYTSDSLLYGIVPTNAAAMRIGTQATSTELSVCFGDGNLLDVANENEGYVFSPDNGGTETLDSMSSQKIALAHTDVLFINGVYSGAFFDVNNAYAVGIPYDGSRRIRAFEVADEIASVGLNYPKGMADEAYAQLGSYTHSSIIEMSVPCTGITLDKTELIFDGEGVQTITATITPSDTTDSVVWVSSDPAVASIVVEENVCTVHSVSNGGAEITVICGNQSATCAVTVSGIVDESLLYSLAEATTFNGTSDYIDTGVKLCDEKKDLTVILDFQPAETNAYKASVFASKLESTPYPGFYICDEGTYNIRPEASNANVTSVHCAGKRVKIALTYSANRKTFNTISLVNGVFDLFVPIAHSSDNTHELTALLGCTQSATGTKNFFWAGTIYGCEIYNRVLDDSEIATKIDCTASYISNWTSNAKVDGSGLVVSGPNVVSDYVEIPEGVTKVLFKNVITGEYTWAGMWEYDESKRFIGGSENGGRPYYIRELQANTKYIRVSANPGTPACTDPANQLVLIW